MLGLSAGTSSVEKLISLLQRLAAFSEGGTQGRKSGHKLMELCGAEGGRTGTEL